MDKPKRTEGTQVICKPHNKPIFPYFHLRCESLFRSVGLKRFLRVARACALIARDNSENISIYLMSYKANFGNSYDYYNPQNVMGHSNVSRSYNKLSARSTLLPTQTAMTTTADSARSSTCSRTSGRSSGRRRTALRPTSTTSGSGASNLRTS